uniref:DNA repair protein XRCC4 n=1 Tax=Bombyx mori TaxID=7091 RepID=A0A8R2C5A1_BOMMO|nr:DNA repair protein XRCC4 [Bombyx mori]
MEHEIFITKHTVQEKTFYLKVLWRWNPEELFYIYINKDNSSWSGEYSIQSANKYREEYTDDSEEEFIENVKRAFRQNNSDFDYDFSSLKDKSSSKFTWKKRFEGKKVIQGTVNVVWDDVPTTRETLIDNLLQENEQLKTTIRNNKVKTKAQEEELEKCKNTIEKFVDIKTTVEETLYAKFVQILNEKKKRIKLLQESLQKLGVSNVYNSESE